MQSVSIMCKAIAILVLLGFATVAYAQAESSTGADPVATEAPDANVQPDSTVPDEAVTEAPAVEETAAATVEPEAVESEEAVQAADDEVQASSEQGEEQLENLDEEQDERELPEFKHKFMVLISDRVSVGVLVDDLFAEYGFQVEAMSKHFGIVGRWAAIQPYPDELGFCFEFGFAFHYYPFGEGPSGLYVGPGLSIMHLQRKTDPIRWMVDPAPQNIQPTLHYQFDLITPFAEIGYRYRFPFYLTLGIEASIGYAFSDQTPHYDSGVYCTVTPVVGFSW